MTETFKCPTCAAPLEFDGKMLQDCRYCGGKIIVPAGLLRDEEYEREQKMKKLDAVLKTVFSNVGGGANQHYVIDLRDGSSKQTQTNLHEIFSQIHAGHHNRAVDVFTQSFGFNARDAENTVTAIEHGRGADVSQMRLYPQVPQKSPYSWIIKLVTALIVLVFVLPIVLTLLFILLMYLIG